MFPNKFPFHMSEQKERSSPPLAPANVTLRYVRAKKEGLRTQVEHGSAAFALSPTLD